MPQRKRMQTLDCNRDRLTNGVTKKSIRLCPDAVPLLSRRRVQSSYLVPEAQTDMLHHTADSQARSGGDGDDSRTVRQGRYAIKLGIGAFTYTIRENIIIHYQKRRSEDEAEAAAAPVRPSTVHWPWPHRSDPGMSSSSKHAQR